MMHQPDDCGQEATHSGPGVEDLGVCARAEGLHSGLQVPSMPGFHLPGFLHA